jgi:flagellar biosynthesis/type III secretory pathway M-ring protein FliF/YscJ
MEQINKTFQAVRRHWTQLSARQRRLARILAVSCGVVLATWSVYRATPRYEWVLSGREFSTRELTVIESALAKAGLDAYTIDAGRVRVPRDERAAYIGALAEGNALPLQFDLELKDELSRSSPWESQEQRRARLKTTEQRELALILRAMKGVEDATVHLDESVSGPFRREHRMTAMVVVRPSADRPLDIAMIRSIRHLVASAKVNLHPGDVTVTDLETGMSYAGDLGDSAFLRSDEFAVRKMSYQRDWQQRVERLLGHIAGVQVAVNVELQYEPHSPQEDERAVLVPTNVGVAIGVPNSFYDAIYREHRRSMTRVERAETDATTLSQLRQQENDRLYQLVKQALPKRAAVTVTPFADVPRAVGVSSVWRAWSDFSFGWQTLVLALLSLGILAVLGWSLLRELSPAVPNTCADTTTSPVRPPATAKTEYESVPGDYHQELTRIVRQDPDAAAAKLAEWIDKAA